ncbi:MAG: 16S rRNA (uracil(1498)-N(3))-methyltransferase [Bacteroidaceae bacterium]|nr:16S rRNA (uracil(1498)-N(3))-methyltransferase [Bacteroidaceae bacterium]MBQ3992798.1 16S rRNA (uracil(1498)-N(3))-methyltransferase [Bacteroidaceae bacterium]
MKEERFFYDPLLSGQLPEDEARHAVRVLRLQAGDEIRLMDGRGAFHRAEITLASNHHCSYRILQSEPQERAWAGHLHLAMAPTKLNDRTEWLAEKATEVGVDEISFLDCQFSERHTLKTDRVERIILAAMKQSHKAWMPQLSEMTPFRSFVSAPRDGDKFICHCYEETDIVSEGGEKPFLLDVLRVGVPTTVLIGPEGDFSIEEVRLAQQMGYRSVTLGRSRLRTETAALVAVHMMQLKNQIL